MVEPDTRLGAFLRSVAAVAVAAIGTIILNLFLLSGSLFALVVWLVGFGLVGALVAVVSPFHWRGLILVVLGIAIGGWIQLQLVGADQAAASLSVEALFAAGLPALIGFLLMAHRRDWLGQGYTDPDRVPLTRPVPLGLPTMRDREEQER